MEVQVEINAKPLKTRNIAKRIFKVTDKSWEDLAKLCIVNFYSRGGVGQGNIDRYIDFKRHLPNVVGFALNCFRNAELSDPRDWNHSELLMAESGNKIYDFDDKGDSNVVKAIRDACNNDEFNFLNVLPIIYNFESNLFFTPLFRVRRHMNDMPHFIDAKARTYKDFNDWEENNSLPATCSFIFPTNGILNGSSTTKRVKDKHGASALIETTAEFVEKYGGHLGILIASPLHAAEPISEIYDRLTHGESINPFKDKEADTLWFNTFMKLSGPFGKISEKLGFGSSKKEKKQTKSELIEEEAVKILNTMLNTDDQVQSNDNFLIAANSFFDNPMSIKDLMKVSKRYTETPFGCLKLSIFLGFFMKTKFYYYSKDKLELIKGLHDIALKIDEAKTFRITNQKEVVVGPLIIAIGLVEEYPCVEILRLVAGLEGNQLSSNIIRDFAKFFRKNNDFLSSMIVEQQHSREAVEDSERNKSKLGANVEQMRIYITKDRNRMIHYQNQDYELSKPDGKNSINCSAIKIMEKRLKIFSKIIHTVCQKDFDVVRSGSVFHFIRNAEDFGLKNEKTSSQTKVFPMLIFVYQTLRVNHIPFTIKRCSLGRPLFIIGYGVKIHLDELHGILKTNPAAIHLLEAICHLDADSTTKLDLIKWNFNNDRALFSWLSWSFKTCDDGLNQILNLHADILSNEFKGMVELFIDENKFETNGLLMIRSGSYKFLITVHVLQQLTRSERISMMKSFGSLLDHDELLINVFGKVFIERAQEDLPLATSQ